MNLPVKKAWRVLREEGALMFAKKTAYYLKRQYGKKEFIAPPSAKAYADVLFVNGCPLPHPYRYRVQHQKEQLAAYGINPLEIDAAEIENGAGKDMLKFCRAVIIYRCPHTPAVENFIKRARHFNKKVFFDIDDLVIDTKYTDLIPYVRQMKPADKALYDDGVNRYRKTMQLTDAVITTTTRLAKELADYMPEVFVNRNTASEMMVALSEDVLAKPPQKDETACVLGYFSGSITHNDDYAMIIPVLTRLMSRHENIKLLVVGELDLPTELAPYKSRIIVKPFVDWLKLPELIASADINLVPLIDNIFNEAKSENKWTEAALVKVPTVASNVGAFAEMIEDGETGLLCADEAAWETALEKLVTDKLLREKIAANAYAYVHKYCLTISTGLPLADFLQRRLAPSIAMLLPSFEVSGGVLVALRHLEILRKHGFDATAVNLDERPSAVDCVSCEGFEVMPLLAKNVHFASRFDAAIATMWLTADIFLRCNAVKKFYLVQNFETGFYPVGAVQRLQANSSYRMAGVAYVTISRWCETWLREEFGQKAAYAPNGIDRERFFAVERKFGGKTRILIEGDSESDYKNVDESFKIVALLPKENFEIWYVSYNGLTKNWYRVDKFMHKVPYAEMPNVYRECHILLKTSILESFSYPPLEMMATGGFVVARENGGNREYLTDGENCLFYDPNDLATGKAAIEKIVADEGLRRTLYAGAMKTAAERDWKNCENAVAALYESES